MLETNAATVPRGRRRRIEAAKVVHVRLEDRLRPLEVAPRYREVRLVASLDGRVLGEVTIPGVGVVPVDVQRHALAAEFGATIWHERVVAGFPARGRTTGPLEEARPSVSVVVCTRDRPDDLRCCLESLTRLDPAPLEIVVVDNAPSDDRTKDVCDDFPVRYAREPHPGSSRARNRGVLETTGELVAFTDDDCVVDARWLDGLETTFSDELVAAATGYIAPLELETRAQYLFEQHGGFQRYPTRLVLEWAWLPPAMAGGAGASANLIVRRSALEQAGLFAEDLGPGTPAPAAEDAYLFFRLLADGRRIVFDPRRLVWHRHRREYRALRRTLFAYAAGSSALAARCLVRHREPHAVGVWAWWRRHLLREVRAILRRDEQRVPLGLVLAEAAGLAVGPFTLALSRWRRRRLPALRPAPQPPAPPARLAVREAAPELSVVLPSRNRRSNLVAVLEGLAAQTYPGNRFETVVVLDGTEDDSAEHTRALSLPFDLRVVEQEHRGLAAGRNRGAREGTRDAIVFLDDDTVPVPGFLAAHAAAQQRSRDDHVALGYYPPVLRDASLWGFCVRAWWEDHFRRKAEPGHKWTYIDFAGGNASFPRRLFDSTGGFDEDFRGRREDWELAVRMLGNGVRLAYYPEALAHHYLDTRFATAVRHARQEARDDVLLASKHPRMKARLPLAAVAEQLALGRKHAFLAFERPALSDALLGMLVPLLPGLEAVHLRRSWARLAFSLTRLSYARGLADSLSSADGLLDFASSEWREGGTVVRATLERPSLLAVPPDAGAIELAVGFRDAPLARIAALEPGGQWDWESVAERVAAAASDGALARLLEAAPADPAELYGDLTKALRQESVGAG